MSELKARDIMSTDIVEVEPDTDVKKLAHMMVDKRIRCIPVVDADGRILGTVTEEDLIHQDARIHFPTSLHFLESYIILPSSLHKFEEELRRAVGAKASEVMDTKVTKIGPDADVSDIANRMVDNDMEFVLVEEDEKLLGIITRADILKAIFPGK